MGTGFLGSRTIVSGAPSDNLALILGPSGSCRLGCFGETLPEWAIFRPCDGSFRLSLRRPFRLRSLAPRTTPTTALAMTRTGARRWAARRAVEQRAQARVAPAARAWV